MSVLCYQKDLIQNRNYLQKQVKTNRPLDKIWKAGECMVIDGIESHCAKSLQSCPTPCDPMDCVVDITVRDV